MNPRLKLGGRAVRVASRAAINRPIACVALWTAVAVGGLLGVFEIRVDSSTSSFLDQGTPEWAIYQRSLARHGGDEFVTVAFDAPEGLAEDALARVRHLTRDLGTLDGVRRVDSLASVPLIRPGRDGELDLTGAVEEGIPRDSRSRERLAEAVRRDLIAPGALVSWNERTLAVNVVLDANVTGDRGELVRKIREIAGSDAWISGVPVFRTQINEDTLHETALLVPVTCGLMAIVLFWALRSVAAAVLPLVVGSLGTVTTLGLMGFVGTPLSLSTMILPSIVLALGSAYAVHVVVSATGTRLAGEIEAAISTVAVPVALSGLTTTLGFLAISTTSIVAIRELALYGALGVMVVAAASLTLLPALLLLLGCAPHTTPVSTILSGPVAETLARWSVQRRTAVVLCWSAIAGAAGVGLASLEVSSDIIRWYSEDSEIRTEYQLIRDRLSGISPVNILIEAEEGRFVTEPEVLKAVDRLATELEARQDVGKVLAVTHPLRLVRRALTGTDSDLPSTRSEAEQYLLVLESEEQLGDLVSRDYSSTNLLLRVDDNDSAAISEIASWVRDWWSRNAPVGYRANTTGIMFEFAHDQDAIARTQLVGLAYATVGVGVVLFLVIGGLGRTLLTLVPNLIPLAAAYGLMGFMGVPLDAATACLGSLALGIAVDDTVHVALGINSAQARGLGSHGATLTCLRNVTQPLALTSLAIAVGFGVLGLSDFVLIRNLGLVTAGVVAVCWAADMTLLPALLTFGKGAG